MKGHRNHRSEGGVGVLAWGDGWGGMGRMGGFG